MLDLRTATAHLIEQPLVPVPPLEGVVARARRYRAARLRRQAGAGVLLVALAVTAVVRAGLDGGGPDSLRVVGDPVPDAERAAGVHIDPSTTTTVLPGSGLPTVPAWGADGLGSGWSRLQKDGCPTAVDPGLPPVTIMANKDVPAPSLEELKPFDVIETVVDFYNFFGGICGRAIELVHGSLADLTVENKVVGAVGTPLDADLDLAIAKGWVDEWGIPVVGGDGLGKVQYQSRYVYPVGTSAEALTRIALDHASARGARRFAIVYDGSRAFGQESLESLQLYLARTGGTVRAVVNASGSASDLVAASDEFRQACSGGSCDFVLLALGADLGDKWLQTRPPQARVETVALPTLLTGGLPEWCFRTRNEGCDGVATWTGFTPWFEQNRYVGDVTRDPASEVRVVKGSAMTEAAGLSARVMMQALLEAGPKVTRKSLGRALDTMAFAPDPHVVLQWDRSLPRTGNPRAQRWHMDVERAVAWADDVVAHGKGDAKQRADATAAFADGLATWASGVPRWAQALPGFAAEAEAWASATNEWTSENAATWWADISAWTTANPVPLPSAQDAPRPPQPPRDDAMPTPPDHSQRPPVPMPDKWWSEEGDWRHDPG